MPGAIVREEAIHRVDYAKAQKFIEGKQVCGVSAYGRDEVQLSQVVSGLMPETTYQIQNNGGSSFLLKSLPHIAFVSHNDSDTLHGTWFRPSGPTLFAADIRSAKHEYRANINMARNAAEKASKDKGEVESEDYKAVESDLEKAPFRSGTPEQVDADCREVINLYFKLFSQSGLGIKVSTSQRSVETGGLEWQDFRFVLQPH